MAISILLCAAVFVLGWLAGNSEANIYRKRAHELEKELARLTDRDAGGRYVKND